MLCVDLCITNDNNNKKRSYHSSRLTSSDFISSELNAPWSDPVRRSCDQSKRTNYVAL